MTADVQAEPLGETALLLRFGDRIDVGTLARVQDAATKLRAAMLPGIEDIAPAYASLLLRFDPTAWAGSDDETQTTHLRVAAAARNILGAAADTSAPASPIIEIPVCYGGESGPDIEDVARHAALDVTQVIVRHTAAEYRVAMLGFAPGFPYLLGLDPALITPRHASPRTKVPAGSVGIGGAQTGIYPRELPGGWQLIGRTPLALFDAQRDPSCLLAPGDRVRFRAIDATEFAGIAQSEP